MAILIFGLTEGQGVIPPHMIVTLGTGGLNEDANDILIDSTSGNIYITYNSSGVGASLVKYDQEATKQWVYYFGGGSGYDAWQGAIDSSENIYFGTASEPLTNRKGALVKYNSSGILQWAKTFTAGGVADENIKCVGIDSSNDLYIAGRSSDGFTYNSAIYKVNSSGVLQWARKMAAGNIDPVSLSVDTGNNAIVTGRGSISGSTYAMFIMKYNSSGVLQWGKAFDTAGVFTEHSTAIDTNSSNDIAIGAYGSSDTAIHVLKYNSAGTLQWQRKLDAVGDTDEGLGVTITDGGDIYACGYTSGNANDIIVAKWNSSGTLQWQRSLGTVGGTDQARSLTTDSTGAVHVVGYTTSIGTGQADVLWAKLPSDGSGTGTTGGLTYAASSLTESAGGFSEITNDIVDTDLFSSITVDDATETSTDYTSSAVSTIHYS